MIGAKTADSTTYSGDDIPVHRGAQPLESRFARLVGFLGLIACTGLVGCASRDDDLARLAVSGTVTFDGQPLAQGRIQFEPAAGEAKITAGGEITDGRFAIPRDQGPTPGDYRIMITSSAANKPGAGADKSPGAEPAKGALKLQGPAAELIPKEDNSKTNLTAKVEASKSNTFEFALKK